MQKLVRGLHAFQANYFTKHRDLFRQLATAGQHPETLFVTCSDSRVVPNLIVDAAPGELFLVRNIGNVIPPYDPANSGATAAAIEYAVCVLDVQNVIVCGHTLCGAMDAILHPERTKDLPHVQRWLRHTQRIPEIIESRYSDITGNARWTVTAQENVLVQLEHLRQYPFVSKKLEEGKLQLNGWMFKIDTGEVFDYDPAVEEFAPLVEPSAESKQRALDGARR